MLRPLRHRQQAAEWSYLQEIIYNNASNIISILSNKIMLCQTSWFVYTEHNGVRVTLPYSLLIQAHTRTVANNYFPLYSNHKPINLIEF